MSNANKLRRSFSLIKKYIIPRFMSVLLILFMSGIGNTKSAFPKQIL